MTGKRKMKMICITDSDWAIGYRGRLLFHLPKDLAYFKKITMGHIIIMGRKTRESLPSGTPLPGRINIVLTRDESYQAEGFIVCHSIKEVHLAIEKLITKNQTESSEKICFVIGGEETYKGFFEEADTVYRTKVFSKAQNADTWFPNLDEKSDWVLQSESSHYVENGVEFSFLCYKKMIRRMKVGNEK